MFELFKWSLKRKNSGIIISRNFECIWQLSITRSDACVPLSGVILHSLTKRDDDWTYRIGTKIIGAD